VTVLPGGLAEALASEEHERSAAERSFRRRLRPLLELAAANPDATDLYVDQGRVRLSFGRERVPYTYGQLGLTPADVRAAVANAAVFADAEFGSRTPAVPLLSVKIPPDLRFTATVPPVSEGLHVAIRFLRARSLTLEDYVAQGAMTEGQLALVRRLVAEGRNVAVSGGTGSGKTTFLRAVLREVRTAGDDGERVLVLEDTPELSLEGAIHFATARTATMAALLVHTLRMTPDRIVVGEVRGSEALELLTAMNTGHAGSWFTVHSNGKRMALRRLHSLAQRLQPELPYRDVTDAVDYVIQIEARRASERRIADIWEVPKTEGGHGGGGELGA
jgi:Flp pilus assembly CpaF family ATPase